jgi:hypothetical protein
MSLMQYFMDIGEWIMSKPENMAITVAMVLFLIVLAIWGP